MAKISAATVGQASRPSPNIDYMRQRCMQLARVLKKTGGFYYHCDWHSDVSKIIREKELI